MIFFWIVSYTMWSSSISAIKWLVSCFGVIWSRESSVKHLVTSCCTMLLKAVTLNLCLGFSLLWRNSLTINCFEQRLTFWVRLHAEQNAMLGLSSLSIFLLHEEQLMYWLAEETPRRLTVNYLFVRASLLISGLASGPSNASVSSSVERLDDVVI